MLRKLIVIIFFLSIALIYLHNLTRDIYSGDVGDLVTAAYVGGVAHPPGYPLFTLLGFIFSRLPLAWEPVTKVGLISVLAAFTGLIIFYRFCLRTTKSIFISLLSTSILAFSYSYWINAEIPEVFALNNFFTIVLIYLSYLFYKKPELKYFFLISLFMGLSLTHHHTIVLIFPTILILVSRHLKLILQKNINLTKITAFFILGFSIYSYVFFAALRNPPINWDNPVNLTNFIRLFLRKDYGFAPSVVNNIPFTVKVIHVWVFLKTLISVYSYQILFVFLIGMISLFKKERRLFIGILVGFLISGPFFIYYAATLVTSSPGWGTIERFHTLPSVIIMFFAPFGFLFIKNFLNSKFSKNIYSYILLSYFLIIPIFLIIYNFPKTDLSKTKIGNTLAKNILYSLPKRAVLFLSGDTTTFNVWYAYYVLGFRKDVDIINPPGVANNTYLDRVINEYHKKFPKVNKKDLVSLTFEEIMKKRPVFSNREIQPMPKNTKLVPRGLIYQLVSDEKIPLKDNYITSFEHEWKKVKISRLETLSISEKNFITPELPLIYSNALVHVGDFLDSYYKDPQTSEHYYRRALWIDNTNSQAYSGLALSLFKAYRDCNSAIKYMKEAISIYPIWTKYHVQLYYLYTRCGTDKQTLDNFKYEFKKQFGQEVEKLINTPPR